MEILNPHRNYLYWYKGQVHTHSDAPWRDRGLTGGIEKDGKTVLIPSSELTWIMVTISSA